MPARRPVSAPLARRAGAAAILREQARGRVWGLEGAEERAIRVLALDDLAAVREAMRRIGVHPGGIAIMAPKAVFRLLLLPGVDPRAANIIKQEMLARGGDAAMADGVSFFSPEPTDVLLMGTLHQYGDLIAKLYRQPCFGLPGLAAAMAAVLARSAPGWNPPPRPPVRGAGEGAAGGPPAQC